MKKIYVLYDHTVYTFRWLSALIWSKKELKKKKYYLKFDTRVLYGLNKKIDYKKLFYKDYSDYDIILIAFHHNTDFFKHDYISFLKKLNKYNLKIIWLDTSDSCGTCNFEVLPYVDKYLKKQIYNDLNNYRKDFYCDRIYCQYYKEKYNLYGDNEDCNNNLKILDKKFENKIGISWNVGLGNIFDHRIKLLLNLNNKKKLKFVKPDYFKKYNLFFNGTIWNGVFGIQRKLVINSIEKSNLTSFNPGIKMTSKEYLKCLKLSKFSISPYGWGEICNRDFETIIYGLVLVKADMSHLKTFPDYYKNDNYIHVNWDMSNLEEQIEHFNKEKEYLEIANRIQEFYKDSISKDGMIKFVNHLLSEMGE